MFEDITASLMGLLLKAKDGAMERIPKHQYCTYDTQRSHMGNAWNP